MSAASAPAIATNLRIAPALLRWWDAHGRKDLPWQTNPTPYRVWVSEIMLQQTQVKTVERYYARFVGAFPDVTALADAESDEVLHLWSGLGYYARARNLHRAAQLIRDEQGGVLPGDVDALQALPGIGRSTAGAILALSMNLRFPILDGNVKRVLARHRGVDGWTGTAAISKRLWHYAESFTPQQRVADYTQAIMDLGATVCTRRNPDCGRCPLGDTCEARRTYRVDEIPASKPKRVRPQRAVIVLMVVNDKGAVLLEKRAETGIWGGLWGLPETDPGAEIAESCFRLVGRHPVRVRTRDIVRHSFSHFDLDMTPVEAHIDSSDMRAMETDQWRWYDPRRPARVGLSAPVTRLLHEAGDS